MIEELATAASLFSYGQEPESVHALAGAVALGTMYPGSNWSVKGGNQARGSDTYRIIIIIYLSSRVLGLLLAPSPHGPLRRGRGSFRRILATWRRGIRGDGLQTWFCPERGSNPGPPSCEAGAISFTPSPHGFFNIFFFVIPGAQHFCLYHLSWPLFFGGGHP